MESQALINLKNVAFSYPQGRKVLDDFSFRLEEGQKIGLVGVNGCGKSTLLYLIMGLLQPQAGEVEIFGKTRKTKKDFQAVRPLMGFVFQDANDQLFCPTVADDLAFGPLNLGLNRRETEKTVKETLGLLGLEGFERRVTYDLSAGEKKLVSIGTALTLRPRLLILDEPTTCLDLNTVTRLEGVLDRCRQPYLIVSHDHDFLAKVTDSQLALDTCHLEGAGSISA
jgi:ABC-type cobalt transport system, ATPase component